MKKILIAAMAVIALAGCTTTERRAASGAIIGGAAGAATGGIVTGSGAGALAGAAIGGAAGAVVGAATSPGDCVYRDEYGREWVAPCPS